jgi:hypothetical protein
MTVKAMAHMAGVSTRTFNRILVATGRATKHNLALDEARKFTKVLNKYNMLEPKALDQALKEWSDGQGRLFNNVKPHVMAPVTDGTEFCLAVCYAFDHLSAVVSHQEGDKVIVDHEATIKATEASSFFKLKLKPAEIISAITKEQVQAYLNKASVGELAGLFYASGLLKIAEIHNTSVMAGTLKHQQAARDAAQPPVKVSYAAQPVYKNA